MPPGARLHPETASDRRTRPLRGQSGRTLRSMRNRSSRHVAASSDYARRSRAREGGGGTPTLSTKAEKLTDRVLSWSVFPPGRWPLDDPRVSFGGPAVAQAAPGPGCGFLLCLPLVVVVAEPAEVVETVVVAGLDVVTVGSFGGASAEFIGPFASTISTLANFVAPCLPIAGQSRLTITR